MAGSYKEKKQKHEREERVTLHYSHLKNYEATKFRTMFLCTDEIVKLSPILWSERQNNGIVKNSCRVLWLLKVATVVTFG